MLVRWHSNPVIAVVLIVGGFLILFTQHEDTVTDVLAAMFILIGGNFGGFYSGYMIGKRAGGK
ncbi:hypothetical protein [Cryobacterium sp. N22]|uniref:hypothetical protein n=1 Tax=Cryobacterium sp. N22 TaxID=2048290 RepID=UPI000CE2C821|nr:hypothetical protein [Cryobacterium sp. N22]